MATIFLLQSMSDAFTNNKDIDKKLPVSISAEMRLLGGSNSILSPTRFRGENNEVKFFALPEIVTHSIGNEQWNVFMQMAHNHMKQLVGDAPLLIHLAKEGFELEGGLQWIREQYDKIDPKDLKAFVKLRDEMDEAGIFTSEFFEQLFGSPVRNRVPTATFKPPHYWTVQPQGGLQGPKSL